jgi:hypothetical protein
MFAYSLSVDGIPTLKQGRGWANTFDGKPITAGAADAKGMCLCNDFNRVAFDAHAQFFACTDISFIKISVRPNKVTNQLADMRIRIKTFKLSEKLPITDVEMLLSAPKKSRITK